MVQPWFNYCSTVVLFGRQPFSAFCNFSSHIVDDAAPRNTSSSILRNIFEINLALNMLELHVIPERPVTTGRLDGLCVPGLKQLLTTYCKDLISVLLNGLTSQP